MAETSTSRHSARAISHRFEHTVRHLLSTVSSFSRGADEPIERKLRAGSVALRRIRCRVGCSMLILSLLCITCCVSVNYLGAVIIDRSYGFTLLLNVGCSMSHLCETIMLMCAPLSDDIRLTRVVIVIEIGMLMFYMHIRSYFNVAGDDRGFASLAVFTPEQMIPRIELNAFTEVWLLCNCVTFVAAHMLYISGALGSLCLRDPMQAQATMWRFMAPYAAMCLIAEISESTLNFYEHGGAKCALSSPYILADVLMLGVATRPHWRRRLHASLRAALRIKKEVASAAGIAGLMCSRPIGEVMSLARERFRCTDASRLALEDLRASPTKEALPANALERTWRAKLGECDAFVSHSWHDDCEAKWLALQRWRQAFVAENGREPWIWFDKFCIDQSDVETDLCGLPIFLSGCRELLVLCGPSYLTRLWCIVELFTFVHMGSNLNRITTVPLLRQGHESEDTRVIDDAFKRFDAEDCHCIVSKDKDKMMGIIAAAFGEMSSFNVFMRNLLKSQDIGRRDTSCSESESETDWSTDPSETGI